MKKSKLKMNMTPGDKSIDPNELFGIWADDPRSVEDIRKAAWERKTKIELKTKNSNTNDNSNK